MTWQIDATQYEKEAWHLITCPKGGYAVDVGAHQGFYTTKLAKEAGPEGEVLAFEPEPINMSMLHYNVGYNNIRNVKARRVALSDHDGEGTLIAYQAYVSKDSAKHFLRGACPEQYMEDKPELHVPKPQLELKVQVRKLDSVIEWPPTVDFIKIDVEGAELKVLKGAERTLSRWGPRLAIETHFQQDDAVTKHLADRGYKLVDGTGQLTISGNRILIYEGAK